MGRVRPVDLATYYSIRRYVLEELGMSDGDHPRPSIPKSKPVARVSREEYDVCLSAELELAVEGARILVARGDNVEVLEGNVAALTKSKEAWRRRAFQYERAANDARTALGQGPVDDIDATALGIEEQ